MKYLIYFVVIIFCIGLSVGVFHLFPIYRAVPQLILLLVIVSSAERHDLDFLYIAIAGGMFMDIVTSVAFGSFTLSFMIIGFLIRFLLQGLLAAKNPWKALPLVVILSIIIQYFWLWLYNGLLFPLKVSLSASTFTDTTALAFGAVIYSVILFFPIYWLIERLHGFLDSMELRKKY